MKAAIIFCAISLLISTQAYAVFGFCENECPVPEVPEVVECPEPEKPKVFHKALLVSDDNSPGIRVYYIYRIENGDMIQVGILDESKNEILTVEDGNVVDQYKSRIQEKRTDYMNDNFPNITTLEFYIVKQSKK